MKNSIKFLISFFACTIITISASSQVELITQSRSNGSITWICYSPQGNYIASANAGDNAIRVWDVRSAKIVGSLIGHEGLITSLTFLPSGDKIVSADKKGKIYLWDLNIWDIVDSTTTKNIPTCFTIDKNGKLFAGTSDGKLLVISTSKLSIEKEVNSGKVSISKMALKNDGSELYVATSNGTVIVFETSTLKKGNSIAVSKSDITGLAYTKNGQLISASTDGIIHLTDIKEKKNTKEIQAHEKSITAFSYNSRSDYAVSASSDKKLKIFNGNDLQTYHEFAQEMSANEQTIRAVELSPDGFTLAGSSFKIGLGRQRSDNTIRIWSIKGKSVYKELHGFVKPVIAFCYYPLANKVAILHDDRELSFWDFDRGEKNGSFQLPEPKREYHPSVNDLKKQAANNLGNGINNIRNIGNGNLSVRNNPLAKKAGKKVKTVIEKAIDNNSRILYSSNGNYFVSYLPKDEIRVYKMENDAPVYKHYMQHELEKVNCMAISPNEKWVAFGGAGNNTVSICNLQTGAFKTHVYLNLPDATESFAQVSDIAYNTTGNLLAVVYNTGKLFVLDSNLNVVFQNVSPVSISALNGGFVNFTRDGKYILYNGLNGFQKVNISGFNDQAEANLKIKGDIVEMNEPQDFAISKSYDGLHVYNLMNQNMSIIKCNTRDITSIGASSSGKISVGFNSGEIRFYDPNTAVNTATMVTEGDNAIIKTSDNYYKVNKNGYSLVTFRVGKNAYPFEQFDLYFNRPSKVLTALGSTNTNLIQMYEVSFEKRLKKTGASSSNISIEELPETVIANRNEIPINTNDGKITIHLTGTDKNSTIKTIQVWLNNVPVYGQKGITVKSTTLVDTTLVVPLVNGMNEIRCAVINAKGNESLNEAIQIESKYETPVNLYVLCIGTSLYKDKNFNLKYAAKDAMDIAALMKTAGNYSKVFTKTLTDTEVTKKNLQTAKEFLASAGLNDVVLVFVAGHGILDKNFNYYYAGNAMDFTKPEKEGISYEFLESIVDAIKAIKKILIMDTCHSGEVDKEDVKSNNQTAVSNGDVSFRAVGTGIEYTNDITSGASKMVKELFADLRKGTGATAISSAGGTEYAMESDNWKNGLFSFCLMNGLKNKTADANNDGKITLHELQAYLVKEVSERSAGKQIPTTRVENFMLDYVVW